ncbi:MAG: glycosyltransferase [Solirubrobacteraceae bacterium]
MAIPALDEEESIAGCLEALAGQRGLPHGAFEVLLVLDGCSDATAHRAQEAAARRPGLALHLVERETGGVGVARRAGMDLACERLLSVGRPGGLVATTDADTRVAPDWLATQLRHLAAGAVAVGGRVELDGQPPAAAARRRKERHARRLAHLRAEGGHGVALLAHPHFGGASIGLSARAYRAVGGLPPHPFLEDRALELALLRAGLPIARPDDVRVTTSARLVGRAPWGLARLLAQA